MERWDTQNCKPVQLTRLRRLNFVLEAVEDFGRVWLVVTILKEGNGGKELKREIQ